jgi:hypothetical protein
VVENPPEPQQAVVLDPHGYWRDDSVWDGNKPPQMFGLDNLAPHPVFTVIDPNAKAMWERMLNLPIDLKLYPMLKLKYRATNVNPAAEYLFPRRRISVPPGATAQADHLRHQGKRVENRRSGA